MQVPNVKNLKVWTFCANSNLNFTITAKKICETAFGRRGGAELRYANFCCDISIICVSEKFEQIWFNRCKYKMWRTENESEHFECI